MVTRPRQHASSLTDSWVAMNDDAQSVEFTSDEEIFTQSTPRAKLSSSRAEHLTDALGARGAAGLGPQSRRSAHSASFNDSTPRKRNLKSSQYNAQSGFVVPTLEHTSSYDGGALPNERSPSESTPARGRVRRSPRRQPLGRAKHSSEESMTTTIWENVLAPSLSYLLSILGLALKFAKPIIAYALAIYLLVGGLIFVRNLFFTSVSRALAPICRVPGASSLGLPFCEYVNITQQHGNVEFDQLITTQSAFEEILTTSAESASLPMDMKRSEASIRDLRHVVEYSSLPSRNELVFEFTGFVETARQASSDLSKYNSRIGRAVDRILSTNRWTLQVLDGIAADSASQGSVTRFLNERLNIFAPFQAAPAKVTRDLLFEQYMRHAAAIEDQILGLITEAQALLTVLQNLDDRLDAIGSIATRDGIRIQDHKDELFALLWTKLGGNRAGVNRVQRQLGVLRDVGSYRRLAFAHVSATVVKLQAIAASLEDLRERVAAPEVVAHAELPIEVHVEQILMGVERLEGVRDEGRKIEGKRLRAILDRDERLSIDGA
ncbi:hypothetical protein ANO11243_011090 [Dothideomycetidae sp. 11243]|nr:hypothetical protein ANO11243_011090 [fungal sp. No.11243]